MAKRRQPKTSEFETALENLVEIPRLNERARIELLIDTQASLNNGDAMAYFGHWLDAVAEAVGIELVEPDESDNPFN